MKAAPSDTQRLAQLDILVHELCAQATRAIPYLRETAHCLAECHTLPSGAWDLSPESQRAKEDAEAMEDIAERLDRLLAARRQQKGGA